MGVSAEGLYLAVFPLMRFGHPPLFFPWTDLDLRRARRLFAHVLEVRFHQAPAVVLRFPESLGRRIAAAGNRAFDLEPAAAGPTPDNLPSDPHP